MNPWDLLQWWNLVFVLPFVAGLIYLLFMCSGLVSSEHGAEVGGDVDHDVDIGHDVNLDHGDIGHDHSVEHDAEAEQDHGVENDTAESLFMRALTFLGVGKAPISMLFMSFCFIWGFTGWAANVILGKMLVFPIVFIWPSLAAASVVSVSFTKGLARLFSRFMPTTETYGTANQQLVGKTAEVLFSITEKFGMARAADDTGNFHDVYCRVRHGKENIPKQARVILMEYDEAGGYFYVKQNPLD